MRPDLPGAKPVAREVIGPGVRWWVGCLVLHKGHPPIYQCGHKHRTREDARDCAETALHIPHDSPLGERIAKAIGAAQ